MADQTPKFAPSASGLLREQLEFVGWTEGDMIPPDLADKLAELKAEAISELEAAIADEPSTALSAQLRKLTSSAFAKITDFPPAQQLAAREYVQSWIEKGQMDAQLAAREAELDAKLPPQLTGAARAQIRQSISEASQSPLFVLEDDTQTPAEQPVDTGVADALQFCPCCNWDLSKRTLEVVPTNSDKQMFLLTLLGDSRFSKTYHVLNKQFTIVFRELTHDETQLIYDELAFAMRRGLALDNLGYFSAFQDARFLLALAELRAAGRVIAEFAPVHEWLKTDPGYIAATKTDNKPEANSLLSGPAAWLSWLTGGTKAKAVAPAETPDAVPEELSIETPLQRYFAYVNSHIPNTTLRHVLRKKEKEFFMLTELLAERVDDENFYAGITISG